MKKIIFTFFIFCLIKVDVYSMEFGTIGNSLKDRYDNDKILEEVVPYYSDDVLNLVLYNIIIPFDCSLEKIRIKPEIFGSINEFKEISSLGEVEVIINIINLSNNNYKYIDKSINISPYSYSYFVDSKFYDVFNYKNYKYFYREVLEMGSNNKYFGISEEKLDKYINKVFKMKFQRIDNISTVSLFIRVNNDNYKDIYKKYGYLGEFSFSLEKIDKLEVIPRTGV